MIKRWFCSVGWPATRLASLNPDPNRQQAIFTYQGQGWVMSSGITWIMRGTLRSDDLILESRFHTVRPSLLRKSQGFSSGAHSRRNWLFEITGLTKWSIWNNHFSSCRVFSIQEKIVPCSSWTKVTATRPKPHLKHIERSEIVSL